MTTVVNLKRLLDRKQWEMCNFAPASTTTGSFTATSNLWDQYSYYVTSTSTAYVYDPFEDGWMSLPSPVLVGTYGAGSCGCFHPWGPQSTATAGTTTTMTTSLNLQRSLKNYTVRFIAGPNAGTEATIKTNTTGANSVITFTAPLGTAVTSASQFILITGRIYVMCATTATATGAFRWYDLATNTWTSGSITNLPGSWGTDGRLVATASASPTDFLVSGTATSGTSNTLVNSSKTWFTNNFANQMIRITGGTGAGQFRTISSNTGTTITVSVAWTTAPDSTSTYQIEGNADSIYLMGNNAVTAYRYSISGNSWTVLSPTTARGGSAVAGCSTHWVNKVTNSDWSDEANALGNGFLNGRYIYSFRGGAVTLDRYDIALNNWENAIVYTPANDSPNGGTGWSYTDNYIYMMQNSPAGRVIKYNIYEQRMEPCNQLWFAQGTTVTGDRLSQAIFTDGATTLRYLYFITQSQTNMFRMLIF
jgi:hypothetical protein